MSNNIRRTIAFVGYDARCTAHALRQFVADNSEQVLCFDPHGMKVVLQDHTLIQGVTTRRRLDGYRLDQIVIADDARFRVVPHQRELVAYLMHIRGKSDVPKEFAVQWYNLDAPAP